MHNVPQGHYKALSFAARGTGWKMKLEREAGSGEEDLWGEHLNCISRRPCTSISKTKHVSLKSVFSVKSQCNGKKNEN